MPPVPGPLPQMTPSRGIVTISENGDSYFVLFGVGVLFAVYFKRYVQVDSVFDGFCYRRIYGQLLGRGRYYRRNNVLRVFSYKLAFVRNCNQHLATVITMILLPIIPERMFGYMYLGLTVPGLVGAIVIMWLFVGETRGLDLKTVTGTEWDKPKKIK